MDGGVSGNVDDYRNPYAKTKPLIPVHMYSIDEEGVSGVESTFGSVVSEERSGRIRTWRKRAHFQ